LQKYPAWQKELKLRAMVMRTAATDGVWANLKHSNDTPGPIKPMDCREIRIVMSHLFQVMRGISLFCEQSKAKAIPRHFFTCIIFRTSPTEKPDLIRKSAEAPAT
jgi:hypothetical protein